MSGGVDVVVEKHQKSVLNVDSCVNLTSTELLYSSKNCLVYPSSLLCCKTLPETPLCKTNLLLLDLNKT